jgi:hypothetical protein
VASHSVHSIIILPPPVAVAPLEAVVIKLVKIKYETPLNPDRDSFLGVSYQSAPTLGYGEAGYIKDPLTLTWTSAALQLQQLHIFFPAQGKVGGITCVEFKFGNNSHYCLE